MADRRLDDQACGDESVPVCEQLLEGGLAIMIVCMSRPNKKAERDTQVLDC